MRRLTASLLAALVASTTLWAGVQWTQQHRAERPTSLPPPPAGLPAVVAGGELRLAELTWPELQQAIAAGKTTVLVPTGGVEQNGRHMILGKHDHIVAWTAQHIAAKLGNALVAPVLSFVPQGGIDPLSGNMRWPGTLNLSPAVFEAVLTDEITSLKLAGFRRICLIGDHGLSQEPQRRVAERLSKDWRDEGVVVAQIDDYYTAANGQERWLLAIGESEATLGHHAGIEDTAELMALHPSGLRRDWLAIPPAPEDGSDGRPDLASDARGQTLLSLKVEAAVAQIQRLPPLTAR
ncbi:MAG TPA: creatininase family protein [Patescibacteria group bacterium]|nr:creatininase family protein [Patescibacteria group bacterium]